jgi:uncharacterized membrane protein
MLTLKLVAVLGCGLIAGVFFAFSSFVMKALAQVEPTQGMTTMQAINVTVINPSFMTVFMGTTVLCLFLAVLALLKWQQPGSAYLLGGCLLYLLGTFLVTVIGNVPLNGTLAIAHSNSSEGLQLWASYLKTWTIWNHIRTLAALGATAAIALTLRP